jgi:aquaporin Z
MPSLPRRAVAELVGTFGLVFIGAGSVMMSTWAGNTYGLLGIALAHGLVLSVMVTATMNISGGHLNPAVTVGFVVTRRIDAISAVTYLLAQLAGAVLAAALLQYFIPANVSRVGALGTPLIAGNITLATAIGLEAVLTFFLVSAVFGTVVAVDAPKVGGFGIGLVLVFDILVGGALTGAAMNPARAFGPALMSGTWVGHAAYWVGPLLGGIVAALLWDKVLLRETHDRAPGA